MARMTELEVRLVPDTSQIEVFAEAMERFGQSMQAAALRLQEDIARDVSDERTGDEEQDSGEDTEGTLCGASCGACGCRCDR